MISLYLGWNGFQGVRFLLPVIVCQKYTKKRIKILSGLNTLFNTGQADRPCPNKPSKFKKKGCEKTSFLLISCITKKPKILLVSMARKAVLKGLRNTPRINTYSIFSIKSLNVS